jgi:hypothetical protein
VKWTALAKRLSLAAVCAALTASPQTVPCMAAAPLPFALPDYESPVRAEPDELLLIGGYGFSPDDEVVYQASPDGGWAPPTPPDVPGASTAEVGTAPVVNGRDAPYSLTVRMPAAIRSSQPYALWIHTSHGEWSKPVKINDARPLWFSPAYAYATAAVPGLPREIKVIGRNLQHQAAGAVRVRLQGTARYTMTAASGAAALEGHVARAPLPANLAPGDYRIQLSRDGVNWLEVAGQSFTVRPDPRPVDEYAIGDARFGGCRPDDGIDDTACIRLALAAAGLAGHGVVTFGPGNWDLIDSARSGTAHGLTIPDGVSMRGAGSKATRLRRHAEWNAGGERAAFTLSGHNVVDGFTFSDLQAYQPHDRAASFLQIGDGEHRPSAVGAAHAIHDIVITGNEFDKTRVAIADSGEPIDRLVITYNTFGAYFSALQLGGNRFNTAEEYRIDDSVIEHNIFEPGSYLDSDLKSGAIASEIGAARHLDFSENTADGSAIDYLNSPQDPHGWRAAFFWNLNGNVEETLVAGNTANCTGDKIGDGEAIAYDNNANTFAFTGAPTVITATADGFTVAEPLMKRQNDREVPLDRYYIGHWVQVVGGPGLGQARRIASYATDPATRRTTFRIAPAWDVVPAANRSRVSVGREFWQVLTLGNRVDHRQPLCRKSNRSRDDAGVITMYAQTADSVIEGNEQYDTDGIMLHQAYIVAEHACADCAMEGSFQSSLDIRSNLIDGKYDWASDCSASGIVTDMVAAPWNDPDPPTVGFGVNVAYNAVRHADGPQGGAIAQTNSWYVGPEPHRWPLGKDMLIQHNSIADIDGAAASARCGAGHSRIGIAFAPAPVAWHTVLYANTCTHVAQPLHGRGVESVLICPSAAVPSCECGAR